MRRTKEEAGITRKQLLEAAVRVFSEKGYAATRLSDIGEEAGVTRGAIYWHFGNKKELFAALFKERVDPFFKFIKEILNEDFGPLDKIQKILTVFFERFRCDRDFLANQHLDFIEMKIRNEVPEIRTFMKEREDKFYEILVDVVNAGIELGEIRKDVDPDAVTSMLATLIAGYAFLLAGNEASSLFKGKGKEMVEIFITGIRA
ncbi:MAG: TetR family transcriptional regulator [Calditrichaeota bacterium]|nr:TetR family transcriptional regulator [Calditrichota bacterium]